VSGQSYARAAATISADGRYRYRLERWWDEHVPAVLFVMLNPSTADARDDDPTIRRCVAFARRWGSSATSTRCARPTRAAWSAWSTP
jgi:hypothetical protein